MKLKVYKEQPLRVYLDLDGVLTDFWGTIARTFGKSHLELYYTDKEAFWAPINEIGIVFWEALPWLPGGRELWEALKPYFPTILTARSLNFKSVEGKCRWIKRHLGGSAHRNAIICYRSEKRAFAAPNAVLIDDQKRNTIAWWGEGGYAIWYRRHITPKGILRRLVLFEDRRERL